MSGGLSDLARWDVPQLRGAVGTLSRVAERLVPWRFRLDAVGRRLATAECWSGPAGTATAAALLEVSTVSTGEQDALEESARLLDALVAAADEAQELAAAALAEAAAGGVGLDQLPVLGLVDPAAAAPQRVDWAAVLIGSAPAEAVPAVPASPAAAPTAASRAVDSDRAVAVLSRASSSS